MRTGIPLVLSITAFALGACLIIPSVRESRGMEAAGERTVTWSFDTEKVGVLPRNWKAATEAANWQVIGDDASPSGKQVLALVRHRQRSNSVRDCCWTDEVPFLDGEISVRFKAVAGDIEKGGGIAWRVKDESTCYQVRTNYSPDGNSIGLYCMVKWNRVWKAYAKDVKLSVGKWHTLGVVHRGDNIKVYLDGKELLNVTQKDSPLKRPGGVGVCTKGDAVTSFDDLTVKPVQEKAAR